MIGHHRYVTVNTDASFHPTHKTSGYAFWIKADDFVLRAAGEFSNKKPANSLEAELFCIANALFTLQKIAPKKKPFDHIVINTDCKFAIGQIGKNKGPAAKEINKILDNIIGKRNIKVKFKYVAAHTGINDARSVVNEWCDAEAKKWMRKGIVK